MLLNTETKDEGDEFLEYCYPAEDQELQEVLSMKGVFLASRGVMRAAVGQEVSLFVFRSIGGGRQYKASFLQVEQWLLCVVLPGSSTDRVARFFVEEIAGLIELRHGRLASLRGHFRQLDPILRAMNTAWAAIGAMSEFGDRTAMPSASLLYMALGANLGTCPEDEWHIDVAKRVAVWDRGWRESSPCTSMAVPEGFALFLCQSLVSTSLDDALFNVCLRLCLLEGVLNPAAAIPGLQGGGAAAAGPQVKCHSLFLEPGLGPGGEASEGVLPSHQYSVLQSGPWLMFVLWRMSSLDVVAQSLVPNESPRTPGRASRADGDTFGTDRCLEFLQGLPLPDIFAARVAAEAARATGMLGASPSARARGAPRPPGTGARPESIRRSFSLPCPSVFKPLLSRSSSSAMQQGKNDPPRCQPSRFLHVLDLSGSSESIPGKDDSAHVDARRPSHTGSDKLPSGLRLRCPESSSLCSQGKASDWIMVCVGTGMLSEWAELDWLIAEHSARRAAWSAAPCPTRSRHAVVGLLRGRYSLSRLWQDCVGAAASLCAGSDGDAPAISRVDSMGSMSSFAPVPEGPTKLGDGEPWRFQAGMPFERSDLSPLLGLGALAGSGASRAWTSAACQAPAADGAAPRRVLLQMGVGGAAPPRPPCNGSPQAESDTPGSARGPPV